MFITGKHFIPTVMEYSCHAVSQSFDFQKSVVFRILESLSIDVFMFFLSVRFHARPMSYKTLILALTT